METVRDFIFLGSKITADGDCSHEIKKMLGRKAMTNLDSILKSRDITLPTKICLVRFLKIQTTGFSISHVWMWELDHKESWTPKNLNCGVGEDSWESLGLQEIKPVYPKGNQSWIFIGRTDVEARTLATWCEELTHWKKPGSWEKLKAEGEGDDRGWDGWTSSSIQWTWVWVGSGSWWWIGKPGMLQSMGLQSRTRLSNWTELR